MPLICFQGSLGCLQTAFSKMHKAADRLFARYTKHPDNEAQGPACWRWRIRQDDSDICRSPERWKRRIEPPMSVTISRGQSEGGPSSEDTHLNRDVVWECCWSCHLSTEVVHLDYPPLTARSLDPCPDHSSLTDTSSKVALMRTVVQWDKGSLTSRTQPLWSQPWLVNTSQGQSTQKDFTVSWMRTNTSNLCCIGQSVPIVTEWQTVPTS